MKELEGKRVLIVGAAGGVGCAVARDLAARGARLHLVDPGREVEGAGADASRVERLAAELRAADQHVSIDARDAAEEPERIVDGAARALGGLDGVVSCAGVTVERSIARTDDDLFARVHLVHVAMPFALLRAALPQLRAAGGGSVVMTTGLAGVVGVARQSAVAAANAGLIGLVRSAAVELRSAGIRVNAVAPIARTRATERLPLFQGVAATSLTPAHVAPVYAFLLSDATRDVTGETLGAAGQRLFAVRARETPGAYVLEESVSLAAIEARWHDATRS